MRYISILLITWMGCISINAGKPIVKSVKTTTYKAVLKDSAWTTGAVVSRINLAKYSPDGNKIAEYVLNPDASVFRKIIYVYEDGLIKERQVYNENAEWTQTTEYGYNKEGMPVITRTHSQIGGHINVTFFEYDHLRRLSKRTLTSQNGDVMTTFEYIYNEAGDSRNIKQRNNKGVLIKEKVESYDFPDDIFYDGLTFPGIWNSRLEHDDVCDEFGNWIYRTEYAQGMPSYIVKRKIDYNLETSDWMRMLLNNKVKSLKQTSFLAIQNGEDISRGKKHGTFADYVFDKDGRVISETSYTVDGNMLGIKKLEYNELGRLCQEVCMNPSGKIVCRHRYGYRKDGYLKHKSVFDARDSLETRTTYIYDAEGNCTKELTYLPDGTLELEYNHLYDAYGQLIKTQIPVYQERTAGKTLSEKEYSYNFQGRIASETTLPLGIDSVRTVNTYRYATSGTIISGSTKKGEEPEVNYIYKFYNDDNGNWKKRVKFVDDKAVLYEERVYTYYE